MKLLDLLFPPQCPFCRRILERPGVCPDCERALPRTSAADGLRDLSGVPCASPLWYQGLVRDALRGLKFSGRIGTAEALGGLLAECAAEHFSGEFDTVTWTPLSRKRHRERGYNQARLLAESACRYWNVKPVRLLEKFRENPAQSGLENAAARWENVRGVYRAVGEPAGKNILLVDDICTTGATLSACAKSLQSAGAHKVFCLTAARTPQMAENGESRKE